MVFFRTGCRFRLWFLNRQLNRQLESESATGAKSVMLGYGRLEQVGLG